MQGRHERVRALVTPPPRPPRKGGPAKKPYTKSEGVILSVAE